MNVEYKFTVELQYIDTKTNKQTLIKPENIRYFMINSDYDKETMPTLVFHLLLDKNLIDDMIKNADVNLINLTVWKFIHNQENIENKINEVYIKDQFNYFCTGDINYRRDLDYPDDNEQQKNDVYKPIMIGLLNKKSIDNKNKSFNFNLINTTMTNAINMGISHMPTVLEPLEYNKPISQLIVPPMNSVISYLKFLNKITVFYSSPFRFFIDHDTAYLISSSGKPIKKKGEKIQSVFLEVSNPKNPETLAQGMVIDEKNSVYRISINALDSKFVLNRATDKLYNSITAVLDISREKINLGSNPINDIISKARGVIDSINNVISSFSKPAIQNANTLDHCNYMNEYDNSNISNRVSSFTLLLDYCINYLNGELSSNDPSGEFGDNEVHSIVKTLVNSKHTLEILRDPTYNLGNGLLKSQNIAVDSIMGSVNFSTYFNGVTVVNLKDNLDLMNKKSEVLKNNADTIVSDIEKVATPMRSNINTMTSEVNKVIGMINSASDEIVIGTVTTGSGEDSTTEEVIINMKPVKNKITEMVEAQEEIAYSGNSINSGIEAFNDSPNMINPLLSQINNVISSVKSIPVDLKAEFSSGKMSLPTTSNIGNINIDSILDVKSIPKPNGTPMPDIPINSLKNNLLPDLNIAVPIGSQRPLLDGSQNVTTKINDLNVLKNIESTVNGLGKSITSAISSNLDSVKDLTSIFSTDTSITEITTPFTQLGSDIISSTKKNPLIMRVKDDNVNSVKNVKAAMEMNSAAITVSKINIDPSVMTINKEYVVKNFDSNNKRDGRFLLTKKREMYIREDDKFSCTTTMILNQLKS